MKVRDLYGIEAYIFSFRNRILISIGSKSWTRTECGILLPHKRTGRKILGGLSDTKPIVCQHFCPTKDKNLPEWG